jgi:hypothetical protein
MLSAWVRVSFRKLPDVCALYPFEPFAFQVRVVYPDGRADSRILQAPPGGDGFLSQLRTREVRVSEGEKNRR